MKDTIIDWVPDACTLPTVEQPLRVAEFDRLFADHLHSVTRPAPTTLDLELNAEARAVTEELAARETACCSFFDFSLDEPANGVFHLRVSVPPTQIAVLDALYKRATSA